MVGARLLKGLSKFCASNPPPINTRRLRSERRFNPVKRRGERSRRLPIFTAFFQLKLFTKNLRAGVASTEIREQIAAYHGFHSPLVIQPFTTVNNGLRKSIHDYATDKNCSSLGEFGIRSANKQVAKRQV